MSQNRVETIYVDLDCLLDTRLGTLAKINPELASNALMNGYHERDEDIFEGVGVEDYRKAYEARDVDTLTLSVITGMFSFLHECVLAAFKRIQIDGIFDAIQLEVNYWPYELDDEEVKVLTDVISQRMGDSCPVIVCSFTNKELTPEHCKKHYCTMVRYDYMPWMEMHQHLIANCFAPGMGLIVPGIYGVKKPNAQELAELQQSNTPPFRSTEMLFAPYFGLKFVDVNYFCVKRGISAGTKPAEDAQAQTPSSGTGV